MANRPSTIASDDIDSFCEQWMNYLSNARGEENVAKEILNLDYAGGTVPEDEFVAARLLEGAKSSGDNERLLPAQIRNWNFIYSRLNSMLGDAILEDLGFTSVAINKGAVAEKLDEYSKKIVDGLTRYAKQKMDLAGLLGQELTDEDAMPVPEDIASLKFEDFRLTYEEQIKAAIDYVYTKYHIQHNFIHNGLYHLLANYKMLYYIDVDNANPFPVFCDERDWTVMLDDRYKPFVKYATAIIGDEWLSCQEVIAKWGDKMDEDDIEFLNAVSDGNTDKFKWSEDGCTIRKSHYGYEVNVQRGYWRADKPVGAAISENKVVEEYEHVDVRAEGKVRKYIQKVYYGIYVAGMIMVECGELKNIPRSQDSPHVQYLPFGGIWESDRPSWVDICRPPQTLLMQVFYSLERLSNQIKGKVLLLGSKLVSGDDLMEFVYDITVHNVGILNQDKEGQLGIGLANDMKEVDLGLSQAVSQLTNFAGFLIQILDSLGGFNDQRLGNIQASALKGPTEQAIIQGSKVTHPIMYNFLLGCEQVMELIANKIPVHWKNKEVKELYMGRKGMQLINIMPDDLTGSDFGVFMINSLKDKFKKAQIQQYGEKFLSTSGDPQVFKTLVKAISAESSDQIEAIFDQGFDALAQIQQAVQKNSEAIAAQKNQLGAMAIQVQENKAKIEAAAHVEGKKIEQETAIETTRMKIEGTQDTEDVRHKRELDNKVAAEAATPEFASEAPSQ